jgi:tellurite methyltransferase
VNIDVMDIRGWEQRYGTGDEPEWAPTPLVIEIAGKLKAGRALDLACGTGRNALWLAQQGWSVTAVDGSAAAIGILRRRAEAAGVRIDARVADLEKGEFEIEPSSWDLIAICYYLQRDLLQPAKLGVVPGGVLMAIVHIAEPGERPSQFRMRPGELAWGFEGWDILHSYEGKPRDAAHARAVAEIVARRV